ncbi:MAG TPA: ABC transporter ATP-binding protein [Candidatus Margulisiibacteriota bacterium]|nr:ABC transporter ATP-binding protein [Candidatus Margulisiibacteriota bacterium]
MIKAEHLTKRFGTSTAISDLSFAVARGEIVGFLGPNGAGKSTTMRILCGVFPPTSGRAVIAGYDVVTDSLRARSVVGYFPERVSLYLDMTVREYLRYVAAMKDLEARQRHASVERALDGAGVAHVAHRLIGTLSKGYRQRVGIAQALLGQPRVLILDEPTAGLDPEQVAEMRHLIRSLRGDSTVILSTHILSEVEATCDRVIIINQGRMLAVDTPHNLNQRIRQTSQIYVEVVGPTDRVVARLCAVPGVVSVEPAPHAGDDVVALTVATAKNRDLRIELAACVAAAGWGLRELRPVALSLEAIFLSLVAAPGSGQAAGEHEVPRRLSA